jgi:hypothetical protein
MEQHKLPNEIYIAGNYVSKEQFGMTDHRKKFEKTFTGNPLLRSQVQVVDYGTHVYSRDNSIEKNWEEAKIVDGVVVWKKSGNIPFSDMLLDFVMLGAITLGVAHMSAEQKAIEQSASLEHLMLNELGEVCLGAEAFEVSEARADK